MELRLFRVGGEISLRRAISFAKAWLSLPFPHTSTSGEWAGLRKNTLGGTLFGTSRMFDHT